MKTIAILSQKGGAGETTLALHLAVAAAKDNLNAVVVDLDPQASAANWGDRRKTELPVVVSSHASRWHPFSTKHGKMMASSAILDTTPRSDSIALQAARAADLILVPCRPAILDLEAIASTLELVRAADTPAVVVLNAVAPIGTEAEEAAEAVCWLGFGSLPGATGQPRSVFKGAHQRPDRPGI